MIYFLIAPIWALCVLTALIIAFIPRIRFASAFLLLGSTFGVLVSLVLSIVLLLIVGFCAKVTGFTWLQWLSVVAYFGGLLVGGFMGIVLGSLLARRVNQWIGWQ
jgi:hypothetical protein